MATTPCAPSRSPRSVPNVVSFTCLIAHHADPAQALALFAELRARGLRPNPHALSAALRACARARARGGAELARARQLHALARKLGAADVFVASALVDAYAKHGDADAARKVFDEMPERSLVSWNALIVGYVRNSLYADAIRTFMELAREGSFAPDEVSLSSSLAACAGAGALCLGRRVHGCAAKLGLAPSSACVANALLDMYGKCGRSDDAAQVFDEMRDRDVVAWNILIMGWARKDRFEEAVGCFRSILRERVLPDEASFSTALHAAAGLAVWAQGAMLLAVIVKSGFSENRCVGSSLITTYAKCGRLDDAYRVFEETKDQLNVVSWTSMIAAFQQHGHGDRVLQLFDEMLEKGIEPDYITFVCVLSACSHNGLVEQGLMHFDSMSRTYNMEPGSEHYACVVDMLGRAGRLDEAKRFVETMPIEPDVSVWGALLGACRNRGDLELGREVAHKLFVMEPHNPGNYVLLSNMYASKGMLEEAKEVRRLMGSNGVKKEIGCSWIDVKDATYVFTVHDQSHQRSEEIYDTLSKIEKLVKERGYVADTRYAVNDVGEYKEKNLWYHSERLALTFGVMSLPKNAPICIKKNLRTCGDCHAVMKIVSGSLGREIVLRDTNRFHRFASGSCSCGDYW
ncbi:Pentatricopeptide repeat-containing protein, chloroplastic [Ananas comosus]|uniref:Pentatricopeptide repeat-containing protein, chloroplastic n=1 Tax=Ananas comosus TaxID=4615 RepID=A0A199UD80_ANACO|nr:Pentatricopeptide repeat-containing protein, chloroplastic [Ananas comosus]